MWSTTTSGCWCSVECKNREKENENTKLLEEIRLLEVEIRKLEFNEKELIGNVKDIETKIILNKNEYTKHIENFTKLSKELEYLAIEHSELPREEINEEEYEDINDENHSIAIKRKMSINEKSRMDIDLLILQLLKSMKEKKLGTENCVIKKMTY